MLIENNRKIFQDIFYQSLVGIEIYDIEGKLIDVNPKCLEIFGVDNKEEVLGFDLFADPNVPKGAKKRLMNNEPVSYEAVFDFDLVKKNKLYNTSKSGICFVDCVINPFQASDGLIHGFIVHVRDITLRKSYENALQKSEELYYQMFRQHSAVMLLIDSTNGNIVDANLSAAQFYGYPVTELQKMNIGQISKITPEELFDRLRELKEKKIEHLFFRHHLASGEIRDVEIHTVPIQLKERIIYFSIIYDITERKMAEDALREAEKNIRIVLNNAPITIFATDNQGVFTLSEGKGLQEVGLKPGENVGVSAFDLYRALPVIEESGKVTTGEDVLHRALSGESINAITQLRDVYFENNFLPLLDSNNQIIGMIGVAIDITEQIKSKKKNDQYINLIKTLYETDKAILQGESPKMIARLALDHIRKFIPCKRASVVTFDLETGDATILATHVDRETNYGDDSIVPVKIFGNIKKLQKGNIHSVKDIRKLKEKSQVVRSFMAEGILSYINIPLISQGQLIGCLNLGSDKTGSFLAEHITFAQMVAESLSVVIRQSLLHMELLNHQKELLSFTRKLSEIREEERQYLSRELHDSIGQNLTALNISLNVIGNSLNSEVNDKIHLRINDSIVLVEETIETIREIISDLRPAILDDFGLMAALKWYCDRYSSRGLIKVDVSGEEPSRQLSSPEAIALYRITQEALTNVMKHSRASRVTVSLYETANAIRLAIVDNGIGFDTKLKQRRQDPTGWGLITMKERAEAIGGSFRVKSKPDKGTCIEIKIRK